VGLVSHLDEYMSETMKEVFMEKVDLSLFVDCVKTLQEIKFICNRAKTCGIEEKDINDILELLKGKV
jgi:hypothetical protein